MGGKRWQQGCSFLASPLRSFVGVCVTKVTAQGAGPEVVGVEAVKREVNFPVDFFFWYSSQTDFESFLRLLFIGFLFSQRVPPP